MFETRNMSMNRAYPNPISDSLLNFFIRGGFVKRIKLISYGEGDQSALLSAIVDSRKFIFCTGSK